MSLNRIFENLSTYENCALSFTTTCNGGIVKLKAEGNSENERNIGNLGVKNIKRTLNLYISYMVELCFLSKTLLNRQVFRFTEKCYKRKQ